MDKVLILFKRGYRVSEDGSLYNSNAVLVGSVQGSYHRISIRVDTKKVYVNTHRLQAFQKYGYKLFEKGIMVRHLDGNSLNNSWDNIFIGNNSDNQLDIPKQIRIKRAVNASYFLRKYIKEEVKKFHSIDKSYNKTMDKFGITSKGTLHYILNN
jgi:hypothetical protein